MLVEPLTAVDPSTHFKYHSAATVLGGCAVALIGYVESISISFVRRRIVTPVALDVPPDESRRFLEELTALADTFRN